MPDNNHAVIWTNVNLIRVSVDSNLRHLFENTLINNSTINNETYNSYENEEV